LQLDDMVGIRDGAARVLAAHRAGLSSNFSLSAVQLLPYLPRLYNRGYVISARRSIR
jgi:hypothetical protein